MLQPRAPLLISPPIRLRVWRRSARQVSSRRPRCILHVSELRGGDDERLLRASPAEHGFSSPLLHRLASQVLILPYRGEFVHPKGWLRFAWDRLLNQNEKD